MNNNITLSIHVKNNVLPKVKSKDVKEQFIAMSDIIDEIGVEGYAMSPKELIEAVSRINKIDELKEELSNYRVGVPKYKLLKARIEEYEKTASFDQNQWLTFLSHPVVAKFLESQILKLNVVIYRQKLAQLANKADISQADIKYITILKDIVDEARNAMENDIIHISSFYPPRQLYESVSEDKTYESTMGESVREAISYLELDTDYMSYVDVKRAKEKEAKIDKRIARAKGIKKDPKIIEKIVDEKSEVKQELLDDIFEGA